TDRPGDLGRLGHARDPPGDALPPERRRRRRGARAILPRGRGHARRVRRAALARGKRKRLRGPRALVRRSLRAGDGAPGSLPRGDADLERGGAARGARLGPGSARPRGRRGPARGLPAARGREPSMSAGRRLFRLGLLLALLGLAVGVYFYWWLEYPRQPPAGAPVVVDFPFGTPTSEIFQRLDREGVVRPSWLAEAYYRIARSASALQAGEYEFDRPTPLSSVLDRMARGDVLRHTIVVPEGLTAEETFELFWSRGISRPEAFRNALK